MVYEGSVPPAFMQFLQMEKWGDPVMSSKQLGKRDNYRR